ncbi:MAG: tRNA lysidine(34) synthetase TilS [Bacteroidales bacterium]|jgi:tRNA(Ile)-lysidine synthase
MQAAFDNELDRLTPFKGEDVNVLLAVSGGIDSMCMANLFLNSKLGCKFSIAHVNFSLRGEKSDGDENMVKEWAKEHGIRFFSNKVDTLKYADEYSISTQMAARDIRYGWFRELISEYSFNYLAIAHNLNDSVETLFLYLLRGTGMKGLSGIRETNGNIIRPLLSFTRAQIAAYVAENNVPFREDETNKESHYMRNRLRNEVFPQFEKINPSFLITIQKEMFRFGDVEQIMNDLYKEHQGYLYNVEDDVMLINIENLKKEKYRGYWLYRILQGYGYNETQISQIDSSLNGQSGKTFLSSTHILIRDREYLKVYQNREEVFDGRVRIKVFPKPEEFNPKATEDTLFIDGKKVKFPLKCRNWQNADKFKPYGMKGFKKLSDFFVDLKLDVEEKKKQIVVTTIDKKGNEQIVCVVGKRIDDRYKVIAATKQIVSISRF